MKKVVAQCDARECEKLDLTYLKQMLPEYGVIYGEEALELVDAGIISPENVIVLQDRNSRIGRKLRKKGAISLVNFCYESQIYAGIYYSRLKKIAPAFKYRIYFKGMFDGLKNCDKKNNFQACYPGVSEFRPEPINWDDRDFVSIVVGNKYYEQGNVFPKSTFKVDKYLKWFVRLFFETKSQRFLRENELQNKRLELIEYFGGKKVLKMYGRGWDNLSEIPVVWQKKLENIMKELAPKPVENKLEVVSKCKFNFAVENLSYDGYVTEKILETMVAKTIPVYLGAKDIADYVPSGCFIDLRKFDSFDALYEYMNGLTAEQAQSYFDCAQEFLASSEGQKYTEESFSRFLADLIILH